MKAKKGDKVKVDYVGKLDDGTMFDSSTHGDHSHPIEFEIGTGRVIKGFDLAIEGMEKGEKKEVHIEAKDAYGERNEQLMQKVPKDKMPPDAKEGMMLQMQDPKDHIMMAKIAKMDDKEATLDLNHPLAGQNLNFELTLVEISTAK